MDRTLLRPLARVLCAAAVLLAISAQSQNLFVSNIGSGLAGAGSIVVYKPGGERSTFATGLSLPIGLAFDNGGNLFEADQQSGNVYRFTPGGVRSTFATGLYEPQGLAFDSAGNLYECDYGSHFANTGFLHRFTPDGSMSTIATGLNPTALAIDHLGNVFVTDIETSCIYKFTPGGVQSTFDTGGAYHPWGLAFNRAGDLFEATYDYDLSNGAIYRFTPGGVKTTFATGLTRPMGLAFDDEDNLFVTDADGTGAIYEYAPNGTRRTFATGIAINGAGVTFQVPEPSGLALLACAAVSGLFASQRRR